MIEYSTYFNTRTRPSDPQKFKRKSAVLRWFCWCAQVGETRHTIYPSICYLQILLAPNEVGYVAAHIERASTFEVVDVIGSEPVDFRWFPGSFCHRTDFFPCVNLPMNTKAIRIKGILVGICFFLWTVYLQKLKPLNLLGTCFAYLCNGFERPVLFVGLILCRSCYIGKDHCFMMKCLSCL